MNDDTNCFWCTVEPASPKHWPYCSAECAAMAEGDDEIEGLRHRVSLEHMLPDNQRKKLLKLSSRPCWKRTYDTEHDANEHIKALVARGKAGDVKRLVAYRCRRCQRLHVGHIAGV